MSASCPDCGLAFRGYRNLKAAKTARDRHRREAHGVSAAALRARRAESDNSRSRGQRAAAAWADAPLISAALAASFFVLVLCPRRRFAFFDDTRLHLIRMGVPMSRVSRRQGYDCRAHGNIVRSQLVTRFMVDIAFSAMRRLFAANPKFKIIFIMEDDCRVKTSVSELYAAALAAGDAVGWLGWTCVGGVPRWGAHCQSYSRASLRRVVAHIANRTESLPAWDTCLFQWRRTTPPLSGVPTTSLAAQMVHGMRGRR